MRARLFAPCLLLGLVGCPQGGSAPAPTPKGPAPDAPAQDAAQDPRRARAQETAQALGKALKAELMAALQEGGPAAGIAACKQVAPAVPDQVAPEGVRVGRTSFKLRNPQNAAPAWAAADVAAQVAEPRFSVAPEGTFRALLPIRLEATCTLCHGPQDELSSEVQAALAQDYPDDQATGFADGDLRGYVWVEVE
ncbi:MAG: DUF3365 domain-containing protein [Planctomycetota bacterium]